MHYYTMKVDEPAGKVPREAGGGGEIPEYTPTEPVAPVPGPLDTLLTTNRMRVVGTPHPGAQRFTVNWKSSDGETLFHFNTRFDARDDLHKVVLLDIHGDIALDQVLIA
uniref:Galectin n=1 Tax=Meloidogyne javanica TaxID=6303 RepID=A0A915MB73_MELJA